jgi:hypothetical protein
MRHSEAQVRLNIGPSEFIQIRANDRQRSSSGSTERRVGYRRMLYTRQMALLKPHLTVHTVGGTSSAVRRQERETLPAKPSSYVVSPKLTTCCLAQTLTER